MKFKYLVSVEFPPSSQDVYKENADSLRLAIEQVLQDEWTEEVKVIVKKLTEWNEQTLKRGD